MQAGYINGEMVVQDGGAHLRSSGAEDLLQWTDSAVGEAAWRRAKELNKPRPLTLLGRSVPLRRRNCLPKQAFPV